ncbi:MAG: hypothetical protein EA364_00820, partial [Balneolaceae bacterium]
MTLPLMNSTNITSNITSNPAATVVAIVLLISLNLLQSSAVSATGIAKPGTINAAQQTYSWIGGTGSWDVAENWQPDGIPGTGDIVTITNGEVTIGGNRSVGQLTVGISGHLTGTGNLTISGQLTLSSTSVIDVDGDIETAGLFTWSAGRLAGEGVLTALGGVSITGGVGSGKILDGRELIVTSGTMLTSNGQQFSGRNGAKIVIQDDAELDITLTNNFNVFTVGEGGAEIVNRGTIRKTTGTTGVIPIDWAITNSGEIVMDQADAHLRLTGAISDDGGTYRVDAGTLTFDNRGRSEPYVFTSSSSILTSPGSLIRFSAFPNTDDDTIYEVAGT